MGMRCTRQVPPLPCDELACELEPKPPREVEWLALPELLPDEDEPLEPCQSDEEERPEDEPQNHECDPLLRR